MDTPQEQKFRYEHALHILSHLLLTLSCHSNDGVNVSRKNFSIVRMLVMQVLTGGSRVMGVTLCLVWVNLFGLSGRVMWT